MKELNDIMMLAVVMLTIYGLVASLLLLASVTILLVSHYLLGFGIGYNYNPLLFLWICVLAITIGPVLELVYGTTYDDDDYDDDYLQNDFCPHNEPLHNHHDGCPACYSEYVDDRIQQESDDFHGGVNK